MNTSIFDNPACQLLSGVDSLYLTGEINYENFAFKSYDTIFQTLEKLKIQAREKKEPQLLAVYDTQVLVQGYGNKLYSYTLQTKHFNIQISPFHSKSIPPLKIQIRSYALWLLGLPGAIQKLETLLFSMGLLGPYRFKPSRLDLCVDVESENFLPFLVDYSRCRARQKQTVTDCENLLYLRYGKGDVQIRMYDKSKEILTSQKLWFYDLWQRSPDQYSKDFSVYRIEYQLRRKALKSLSINCMDDLYNNLENIWAYLTQDWYKLVYPSADKHKDREKITPFWLSIQTAFTGFKEQTLKRKDFSSPLDGVQLSKAMVGMVLRYAVNHFDDYNNNLSEIMIDETEFLKLCKSMLNKSGADTDFLTKSFLQKL